MHKTFCIEKAISVSLIGKQVNFNCNGNRKLTFRHLLWYFTQFLRVKAIPTSGPSLYSYVSTCRIHKTKTGRPIPAEWSTRTIKYSYLFRHFTSYSAGLLSNIVKSTLQKRWPQKTETKTMTVTRLDMRSVTYERNLASKFFDQLSLRLTKSRVTGNPIKFRLFKSFYLIMQQDAVVRRTCVLNFSAKSRRRKRSEGLFPDRTPSKSRFLEKS